MELSDVSLSIHGYYSGKEEFVYGFELGELDENMNVTTETYPSEYRSTFIKTLQIGKRALDYFEIADKIVEGRSFTDDDFYCKNNRIPIIVGYEYKEVLDIGDTIECYYLWTKFEGEVIGILEENVEIPFYNGMNPMNRYIMMPFIDISSPIESKAYLFDEIHLLCMTAGFIPYYTKDQFNEHKIKLEGLAADYDLAHTLEELKPSQEIDENE